MTAIYKLVDAFGRIGYVGKTEQPLARRLSHHLHEARCSKKHSHKLHWLRSLSEPPTIVLIEETPSEGWAALEIHWIALAAEYGCKLVNGTEGGEGGGTMRGKKHSLRTREKMSVAATGRVLTLKTRSTIRAIKLREDNPLRGKNLSLEHRRKQSLAAIGRKHTPETIEKLKKPKTPEHRENLRVAALARIR